MNRQRRSGYTVQCSAVFALVLACGFVVPPAQSQTLHVLYNFTGGVDGADPFAGLTVDQAGNFYGVAAAGGVQTCGVNGLVGCGTAFVLQRSASGWRFTTLYDFAGGSDGFSPGELSFGPGGAMYGSTEYGGAGGSGIVFRLQPPLGPCKTALCYWTKTTLYGFSGGQDGNLPSGVVADSAGNLYGTTYLGGTYNGGTVFELSHASGGWTKSVVYSFGGPNDGLYPSSGVVFDRLGNLYGVTYYGGTGTYGTLYQLKRNGTGWTETVIDNFTSSGVEGSGPDGDPIFDASGNLYMTNTNGGINGGGTVVKFTPSGNQWMMNVIYSFLYESSPDALSMDSQGNLYGILSYTNDERGSIFKLTPSANGWVYTDLHDFTGYADGQRPGGPLIINSAGNVFGTAAFGGSGRCNIGTGYDGCGTIWEITPN